MPDFGRRSGGGGDPSLNDINRVDQFVDALSTNRTVYSTDAAEAELAFLLADWRDDVREAPITAPVTPQDAVIALHGGLAKGRSARRGFTVVGSVAAAMLCIGGFGAAVYGAGPGDSLYGMRSTLFGTQQATRDDQVSLASAELQQVQQLIDQGQWQQSQDKLVAVSSTVQGVAGVENKQDLVEQWNALTYKVVEQNPAATLPPGEPLPVLPSSPLTWLPVPVVEETPTSETTNSDTTTSGTTTSTESSTSSDPSTSGTATTSETSTTSEGATSSEASPTSETPTTSPQIPTPTSAAPPASAPPPVSTTTTVAPTTTTTVPAPSTTTTTTRVAAEAPAPAASPPKLAPSSSVSVADVAAPSQPAVSSQPVTTSAIPSQSPSSEVGSAAVTTTTGVPSR